MLPAAVAINSFVLPPEPLAAINVFVRISLDSQEF